MSSEQLISFADFFIEDYPEIASQYPMMRDCVIEGEYPQKAELVRYLETAPVSWASMSDKPLIDVLTGEPITGVKRCGRSDGDYAWTNVLAYYVDRYNIGLPDEFVKHATSRGREA